MGRDRDDTARDYVCVCMMCIACKDEGMGIRTGDRDRSESMIRIEHDKAQRMGGGQRSKKSEEWMTSG